MIKEQPQQITANNTPVNFKMRGGDCIVTLDGANYTGLSFAFNVSNDGGATLKPVAAQLVTDNSLQTGTQSPANGASIAYRVNTAGWPLLQVTPSALTAGPVNVAVDQTGITFNQNLILSSLTGPQTFTNITFAGTETTPPGASTIALGTNSANAAVLPAATASTYPTTGANGTVGVRINAADQITGRFLIVGNGAQAILKVYPPTGGTINGLAADAAYSCVSGSSPWFYCLNQTTNTWHAGG
jgi:uncharacterized protein with beta-barrel porin domain